MNTCRFTLSELLAAIHSVTARDVCKWSAKNTGNDGAKLPALLKVGDVLFRHDISQKDINTVTYMVVEEPENQNWATLTVLFNKEVRICQN